jgi:hypothetical protein
MAKPVDRNAPRRAPKGYVRGAIHEFKVHHNGQTLPPVFVQCYLNKRSGGVLGFGLSEFPGGRLERPTMAEWKTAVHDAILGRTVIAAPTRHIAAVVDGAPGQYWMVFWPVLRRTSLDGAGHWSAVQSPSEVADRLPDSAEIDWGEAPEVWTTSRPVLWSHRLATILDWAPETWDALVAARRSLDRAVEQAADLVASLESARPDDSV